MAQELIAALRVLYRTSRSTARAALLPMVRPRRIDVCCCGLSKTGTHSIAGIFENYCCEHHPDADIRLPLATAYLNGEADVEHARAILKKRDRWMWLEVESSTLSGILIRAMTKACPTKNFILTIRDVYSWCDSWLDHNINSPPRASSAWVQLDQVRLRVKDFPPTRYDTPLIERGFPPLPCFFQLWQTHNAAVLETVPEERLLIVKTEDIPATIPKMAQWLGISADTLSSERSWLFATSARHGVLGSLDPNYVRDTKEALSGSLMQRFFPDTRLDEVVSRRKSAVSSSA